jgi:hypothetical protein
MQIYFFLGRLKSFLKNKLTYRFGVLFVGISTTIWFLIRVIPKPQRASYPCMQAAAPFMSAFVLYLLGLFGSTAAFRLARKNYHRSRYLLAATFLIIALFFTFLFIRWVSGEEYSPDGLFGYSIRQWLNMMGKQDTGGMKQILHKQRVIQF